VRKNCLMIPTKLLLHGNFAADYLRFNVLRRMPVVSQYPITYSNTVIPFLFESSYLDVTKK
jgi:hypothetical protein